MVPCHMMALTLGKTSRVAAGTRYQSAVPGRPLK